MSYLQTKYPDMVEVINFGETYEFHKINGLKVRLNVIRNPFNVNPIDSLSMGKSMIG